MLPGAFDVFDFLSVYRPWTDDVAAWIMFALATTTSYLGKQKGAPMLSIESSNGPEAIRCPARLATVEVLAYM